MAASEEGVLRCSNRRPLPLTPNPAWGRPAGRLGAVRDPGSSFGAVSGLLALAGAIVVTPVLLTCGVDPRGAIDHPLVLAALTMRLLLRSKLARID